MRLSFELDDILHNVVTVVRAQIMEDDGDDEGFLVIFVHLFQQSILKVAVAVCSPSEQAADVIVIANSLCS